MNDKWGNRDLKLMEMKKKVGETEIVTDEWTNHVSKLEEGAAIVWTTYHGFYHSPYEGEHTFTFTLIEASDSIRIKAMGNGEERNVVLGYDGVWTTEWYEVDGWRYCVVLQIVESTYAVHELPSDVRTMQQVDHDAWDYAVRNGLI